MNRPFISVLTLLFSGSALVASIASSPSNANDHSNSLSPIAEIMDISARFPLEILFVTQTIQYPNYQELVFANNPKVMALLGEKKESVEFKQEYIKATFGPQFETSHRIITKGISETVVLNQQIATSQSGIVSRLLSFRNVPIGELSLDEAVVKQEERGDLQSRLGQISLPIHPARTALNWILGAIGCSSVGQANTLLKQVESQISEKSAGDSNLRPTIMIDQNDHQSVVEFSDSGMPVKVVALKSSNATRTTVEIEYSTIDVSEKKGFQFPKLIRCTREVLVNGEYKAFIVYDQRLLVPTIKPFELVKDLASGAQFISFGRADIDKLRKALSEK